MSEKPQNLPNVEERVETNKPVDNPSSQKSIEKKATAIAIKPDLSIKTKEEIDPKGEEGRKGGDKLKAILEGKEKSPELVKTRADILKVMDSKIEKTLSEGQDIDSISEIIKKPDGTKFETKEEAKEFLREQFLKGEIKSLDIEYDNILEENKSLLVIDEQNPEFAKELIGVYGKELTVSYSKLLKDLPVDKIPETLEEFDKIKEGLNILIDEKIEIKNIKENTIIGDIPKETPGYSEKSNGTIFKLILDMLGFSNLNSYNGNTYSNKMSVGNDVNMGNIDSSYSELSNVKNNEISKNKLENSGLNKENKEFIFNRVPEKWFGTAIDFIKKEGGSIKKDIPLSFASVSEKRGLICYPNGKFEEFPIITAQKGRITPVDQIYHFDGGKISGKGNDASKGGSKTVLGAAAYSPEGASQGGKWWHGVKESRIPNGGTWGCIGLKQEISIRMVRNIQQSGGGYGYNVDNIRKI